MNKILRKFAARARRRGLTKAERAKERRLRKKVVRVRREIRGQGTASEKKRALLKIMRGTIEWHLIYGIRGQNEGINGIFKKRGNLIGDGQHTSWLIGHSSIKSRVNSNTVSLKMVSYCYCEVMGTSSHCMRRLHNWRREKSPFIVIFWGIFCRITPNLFNNIFRKPKQDLPFLFFLVIDIRNINQRFFLSIFQSFS